MAAAPAATAPPSDDHPLALELASLRAAAARYQHEAHATSLKLQRHSVETSQALERAHALERENAALVDEVAALRAHPDVTPHPAALQVPELTLALRKLSDKLDATEQSLLAKTDEVVKLQSDLRKSEDDIDTAYRLEAAARAEAEEAHGQTRTVERALRKSNEEKKLVDLVVQEYADLVRNLEGRSRAPTSPAPLPLTNGKNDSSATLVDSLSEGKTGLRKLFEEFGEESARLEHELARAKEQHTLLSEQLATERARGERDRMQLAAVLQELEKLRIDDNTAAKMVSRYMKFSQSTTDSLQTALENIKARHAATDATLSVQLTGQRKALAEEHRLSEKLRTALDELTEDISREAYGRRREVSLRLAFLSREEALAENLRRWIRRSRETLERASPASAGEQDTTGVAFAKAIHDAEALLETLNGQPALDETAPGSVARVVLAQDNVAGLARELQVETDRRLRLEHRLAEALAEPQAEVKECATGERHAEGSGSMLQTVQDEEVQASDASQAPAVELSPPFLPPKDHRVVVAVEPTVPVTAQTSASATAVSSTGLSSEHLLDQPPRQALPAPSPSASTLPDLPSERDASVVVPLPDVAPAALPSPQILVSPPEIPAKADTASPATASPQATPSGVPTSSNDIAQISEASSGEASSDIVSVADVSRDETKETIVLRPFPPPLAKGAFEEVTTELSPIQSLNHLSSSAALARQSPSQQDVFAFPATESPTAETHISPLTSKLLQSSSVATTIPSQADAAPPSRANLLASLAQAKHRYDSLQRAFRDCHLALRELKASVSALPPRAARGPALQRAVERLYDTNEDARVELEIRVADEARIAHGFEALLSIPGALAAPDIDVDSVLADAAAFVAGTDSAVQRAQGTFGRKLDDLQHDIACVKRAVYELSALEDEAPAGPAPASGLVSWTAGLLGAARPASPAPTFGALMTSPRSRYNSLSSHTPRPSAHSRRPTDEEQDPLAGLGLRIPMPALVVPPLPPSSQRSPGAPRARTVSTMYMLGLGARSSSFGLGSPAKGSVSSPLKAKEDEDGERDNEDVDSDVE